MSALQSTLGLHSLTTPANEAMRQWTHSTALGNRAHFLMDPMAKHDRLSTPWKDAADSSNLLRWPAQRSPEGIVEKSSRLRADNGGGGDSFDEPHIGPDPAYPNSSFKPEENWQNNESSTTTTGSNDVAGHGAGDDAGRGAGDVTDDADLGAGDGTDDAGSEVGDVTDDAGPGAEDVTDDAGPRVGDVADDAASKEET